MKEIQSPLAAVTSAKRHCPEKTGGRDCCIVFKTSLSKRSQTIDQDIT